MKVNIETQNKIETIERSTSEGITYFKVDYKTYENSDVLAIFEKVKEEKDKGQKVAVTINGENRNFNDDEIAVFLSLESKLKEIETPLYIDGGFKDNYTVEELVKADKILDAIIDKINKSELSPLEKYLYIYNYLSKKKYKYDERERDPDLRDDYNYLSRDIISVVNSDEYIVCYGYAMLNAYICKDVGIKCRTNELYVIDEDGSEAHMNNVVFIKDDKYGVDGVFYSDPCWDNDPDVRRYSFALVPMDDVTKINITIRNTSTNILFLSYIPAIFAYVEGSQGLDLISLDYDKDGKPCYYYETIAEELHIEKELLDRVNLAFDIFKQNYHRVEQVISLFKENDVPKDFYEAFSESDVSTSLPFFLAATILGGNNGKIIQRAMSVMRKQMYRKEFGIEVDMMNPHLRMFDKVHNIFTEDLYQTLDDFNHLDEKEFDMSFLKFYDKITRLNEARMEIDLDDDESRIEYRHRGVPLNIAYRTVVCMYRMMIHAYFQKEVFKKYSPFAKIDPKAFKDALVNVYIFEGLTQKEADAKAKEALNETNKINKRAYNSSAYSYNWLDKE